MLGGCGGGGGSPLPDRTNFVAKTWSAGADPTRQYTNNIQAAIDDAVTRFAPSALNRALVVVYPGTYAPFAAKANVDVIAAADLPDTFPLPDNLSNFDGVSVRISGGVSFVPSGVPDEACRVTGLDATAAISVDYSTKPGPGRAGFVWSGRSGGFNVIGRDSLTNQQDYFQFVGEAAGASVISGGGLVGAGRLTAYLPGALVRGTLTVANAAILEADKNTRFLGLVDVQEGCTVNAPGGQFLFAGGPAAAVVQAASFKAPGGLFGTSLFVRNTNGGVTSISIDEAVFLSGGLINDFNNGGTTTIEANEIVTRDGILGAGDNTGGTTFFCQNSQIGGQITLNEGAGGNFTGTVAQGLQNNSNGAFGGVNADGATLLGSLINAAGGTVVANGVTCEGGIENQANGTLIANGAVAYQGVIRNLGNGMLEANGSSAYGYENLGDGTLRADGSTLMDEAGDVVNGVLGVLSTGILNFNNGSARGRTIFNRAEGTVNARGAEALAAENVGTGVIDVAGGRIQTFTGTGPINRDQKGTFAMVNPGAATQSVPLAPPFPAATYIALLQQTGGAGVPHLVSAKAVASFDITVPAPNAGETFDYQILAA